MARSKDRITPESVRIESSSRCQLKCPSCPTGRGETAKTLGLGSLSAQDFQKLLDQNPSVKRVELSNYGELFLNRQLPAIIELAAERGVALTASNGSNMNFLPTGMAELLVRHGFFHITCSIDGITNPVYRKYRRGGDVEKVIANIREINEWKKRLGSPFPFLDWQFVLFGHNEHEVEGARALAAELGMKFSLKLSWDEQFSPPSGRFDYSKELLAMSRTEYKAKFGAAYRAESFCRQLWEQPQINWNGDVLGCCVNHWGSFGNVFRDGSGGALNSEPLVYARKMLSGRSPERSDIPCVSCTYYQQMRDSDQWLGPLPASPQSQSRPRRRTTATDA